VDTITLNTNDKNINTIPTYPRDAQALTKKGTNERHRFLVKQKKASRE
jgi:hypothetical protein